MTLSPEQREEITRLNEGQMALLREAKVIESINNIDIVAIPNNWLDDLLSSEQALKKENAELKKEQDRVRDLAIECYRGEQKEIHLIGCRILRDPDRYPPKLDEGKRFS